MIRYYLSHYREREQLVREKENNLELKRLAKNVVSNEDVTETPECFFMQLGILMRKWRPKSAPATDKWRTVYQIAVAKRNEKMC